MSLFQWFGLYDKYKYRHTVYMNAYTATAIHTTFSPFHVIQYQRWFIFWLAFSFKGLLHWFSFLWFWCSDWLSILSAAEESHKRLWGWIFFFLSCSFWLCVCIIRYIRCPRRSLSQEQDRQKSTWQELDIIQKSDSYVIPLRPLRTIHWERQVQEISSWMDVLCFETVSRPCSVSQVLWKPLSQ